jgi:ElaB/YqjD/DUF883 family membrane-anchored ribosome-binding protein
MMSTTFKKDQTTQAKESAGQAVDKAKEAASHAGTALQEGAQAVGHTAEDATAAVGRGMERVAGTVRDQGPHGGVLGSATHSVADAIEGTGKYLEEKNLSGMMEDVTGLIKRNPIPAVLIGLGVGFLIGRALTPSSRNWS